MQVLLEASFALNSVFPEYSIGFPIQALLGLICFLLPVVGFFVQVLIGKHLPRQGDWLPTGAMFLSFLCAASICVIHLGKYDPNYAVEWRVNWLSIEGDGHGVQHTQTTLAKLHLPEALIDAGLIDGKGQVVAKEKLADGYLASEVLPLLVVTEADEVALDKEPSAFWRGLILSWLASKDGKKRAENHAAFDAWFMSKAADAKTARDALKAWVAKPENQKFAYVNEVDSLKNSFAIGILIDNTTAITLFMVTLLSFLIHLFSTGYMQGEVRYGRFFATINLFTVGMIGLVLANNFLWLFVCWEIMGLCSYLLIGHYYEKPSAQAACVKAFITTRIGDCFMFIGMMIIFLNTKTLLFSSPNEFQAMFAGWTDGAMDGMFHWGLTTYGGPGSMFAKMGAQAMFVGGGVLTAMGILLFIGPVGKSAQFPLHVWLPDAMEGPTPVSAMIHAACMVSAGVYLTARLFPLFTPDTLMVIAYVGGFTALFAGTIGLMQTDIKKVLAFSTISQLGYMFLGIGVGAWVPAVFHMITHAFFKALMFLGSGSVILGCSHEQEMTRMGGLWKKMPITTATFWIGNLAITGAPFFFSGFYSKEAVLTQAMIFGKDTAVIIPYVFGALGAGLTTFYMFRLVWMTFHGKPRDKWVHDHAKESPWNVVLPLIVIAGFATVVGWPLAAQSSMAENLGFSNVVEFGVLGFITIVVGLMCGLYLFRRRDEAVKSPMMQMGAWSVVVGLPVFFVLYVGAAYMGYAPRSVNKGPHGETAALYKDAENMVDLKGLQQVDGSSAIEHDYEELMLAEITRQATKKGMPLSEVELKTITDEFQKTAAEAAHASHGAGTVGRPSADGLSWFYYLVNKPRTVYSKDYLINEARFDAKRVELLYIGENGHGLFADSPGMLPSAQWGGRYNEWRKKNGLAVDARFEESEKAANKAALIERESARAEAIAKANEPAAGGHDEHGAHGHEGHAHDPVTHAWHEKHHGAHLQVFGGSMVAFLIGLALSMFFFSPWGPFYRREWVGHVGFLAMTRTTLKRGYFMDDFYYGTVVRAQGWAMRVCSWFDKVIIDGIVNLVGRVSTWMGWFIAKVDFWGVDGTVRGISNATGWAGSTASKAPTGKISDYVFMLIAALVLVFILLALMS